MTKKCPANIKYRMPVKKYLLDLSLNKKLIGMMILLSLILILVLLFFYSQSEKALLAEIENQTAELSKAIQIGVEEVTSIGYSDEARLRKYLRKLNTKGIKEISIISNTDEIIASTNPRRIGENIGPLKKVHITKAELGEPVSKEGKIYNVIIPVIAENEHYGYIHLKINAEDFSEILRNNTIKRIFGALFVFLLGILLSILLSMMYTKPIHNVVSAAKTVAKGDLTVDLKTDRKDEIGELTRSFNLMIKRLREERELEQKLREVEHLSGLTQLAKSIAHEIRNPLNFISLSIDHLKKKYCPRDAKEKEAFESLINSMKQEIQRLNKLVCDFLDYGKPLKLKFKKVNINDLINELLTIVHAKAERDNVNINVQLSKIPEISVDEELIKTCILNIILNAFQAISSGGTITIKTITSDNKIIITVEDTGVGISKDNIQKVFDPFFTTKNSGLGLGLSITKRVIEEHGGKVFFDSIEGKGTTVTILLYF